MIQNNNVVTPELPGRGETMETETLTLAPSSGSSLNSTAVKHRDNRYFGLQAQDGASHG